MNTTANSDFGAAYVLRDPVNVKGSRTGPIEIAVTVNVLLILGLAKGLGVIHIPTTQTITEAFSVPEEIKPADPLPELVPPAASVDLQPLTVDTPPPVIVIEPDVPPVTTTTSDAISAASEPQVGAVDTPLAEVQLVRRTEPQYPAMSKRMDEQGTVVTRLTILPSGRVSKVDVIRSSGHSRLDQAARDAVRNWIFARRDGASMSYTVTVPVKFSLTDS
jgi:protein TonB